MSAIQISIGIMQAPDKIQDQHRYRPLVEKIEQYLNDINSNFVDSKYQWNYLKAIYNNLSKKTQMNDDEREIFKLISPDILKHFEYDTKNAAQVDSATMLSYLDGSNED